MTNNNLTDIVESIDHIYDHRTTKDGRRQKRKRNSTTKSQWKTLCDYERCGKYAQDTNKKGGLCREHGAELKQCKYEGCTSTIQNNGYCFEHGASYKRCKKTGCNNIAVKSCVCAVHGAAIKKCIMPDCCKYRQVNRMCCKCYRSQRLNQ